MEETGTITTHESGVDLLVEWQVPRFSTLRKDDGVSYCSPAFSFGGERWYFGIYPNGRSTHGTSGYVDLCLGKWFSGCSMNVSVSLSLKTAEGGRHREEHCTKEFVDRVNWFHGFNRFVPRTELTTLRSALLPDDVLTVVCTMKGSTSAGSDGGEASNAEINKSDVAEASGSSQAGTTTTKDSVLKWIEENCKVASKGKKRKTEAENILKWIEQNYLETSNAKKRRMEEKKDNPVSAENGSSDFDSDKSSSESESVECCHKCPKCLAIVKKQTKLLEKLGSQKETSQGGQSLCEIYKKVLLDGRHHDLILKVGDKELRAHRDVLRARSKVFESMLDHEMKEKNTGVIDVPDCDPDAMELFLSYVYCGKIDSIDHSNMLGLYYIADKYEMTELKRECCNFIKESLSLTNICSVIQLALNHSDSKLLEYIAGYFAENMQTVEWQSFHKDNFTVGNELIMKSIKKLKNEQT